MNAKCKTLTKGSKHKIVNASVFVKQEVANLPERHFVHIMKHK